jgi:hypothetical protein
VGWWDGGLVGWWDGGMEGWRDGGMEGWRDGGRRRGRGELPVLLLLYTSSAGQVEQAV